jgi:hypothetical protein
LYAAVIISFSIRFWVFESLRSEGDIPSVTGARSWLLSVSCVVLRDRVLALIDVIVVRLSPNSVLSSFRLAPISTPKASRNLRSLGGALLMAVLTSSCRSRMRPHCLAWQPSLETFLIRLSFWLGRITGEIEGRSFLDYILQLSTAISLAIRPGKNPKFREIFCISQIVIDLHLRSVEVTF